MIEAENLTKKFGDFTAVDNISFKINDGEIFGFLGPNGAGKTTTIRMLTTLIRKTSGSIQIEGMDASDEKNGLKIRQLIGLLPENPGLYEKLSVTRNLKFYAELYGMKKEDADKSIEEYLKMLDIWDKRNDAIGGFSKGMKQKVAIARALLHEPKYLFLDEPTSGLDPEAAKTVRDFILAIKKDRIIFINTHNLYEAQRICDRVGIIRQKILEIDSPKNLENKLYSSGIVIEIGNINENMLSALKNASEIGPIEVKGNEMTIKSIGKEKIPEIIDTIIKNKGKIYSVQKQQHSLEDIYFKLVGGHNEAE
jgi:ABC-2 type transport system ATP-binding protein